MSERRLVALPFILFTLAASVPAWAQDPGPRELPDDALRIEHSALARRMFEQDPVGGQMVSVFVRGPVSPGALSAMGAEVNTVVGDLLTARMPLVLALEVRRLPGVESVRLATPLQLDLDLAVPNANANNKRTQSPPLLGFNGNNVVVGFVDSGIQYQHDDFKNPDGSTRLLSIWDQTVGTVSPPSGFSYGREWTQAQINAGTATEVDVVGHGTHVAGIAVGDGSATGNGVPQFKYSGMANKASIVMVKTNFTDTGLLDAVSYVFQRAFALGWPAVVNLSLSSNLGPHDGTSDLEIGLNGLIGPGKVIVSSAGNNFGLNKHARVTSTTSNATTTMTIPAYTGTAATDFFLTDGWYESTDNYRIQVTSPTGKVFGPVNRGSAVIPPGNAADPLNADGRVYVENGVLLGNQGDYNVYIEVSDIGGTPKPRNGNWVVTVIPVSVVSAGRVDFWSYSNLSNPGAAPAAESFTTGATNDITLGTPSMADSVICVAAHVSKASWTSSAPGQPGPWGWGQTLNAIGTFSSSGPRRDNVMKPDISAPGSAVASALSTSWVAGGAGAGWDARFAVDDGVHAVQQGTSMSAPMVTGAVAMMLQQNPSMGPTLARQPLTTNALVDANVNSQGAVPNKRFGWGKLNLTNVLPNVDAIAPNTTLTRPNGGEVFAPSTQEAIQWTASDNIGVTAIDLEYSNDNGLNWNPIVNGIANSGSYLWTVPGSPTTQAKVRVTAHDTQNQTSDASNAVFTIGTGVDTTPQLPLAFAVARPTPSPFTALTTVAFDLPATDTENGTWPTTVRIYNIAGRLVRNVIEAPLPPGPHTAAWDGTDQSGMRQPAGVYFVEVATPKHRGQVRAVYLR